MKPLVTAFAFTLIIVALSSCQSTAPTHPDEPQSVTNIVTC